MKKRNLLFIVLILALFLVPLIADFWVDYLWFSSLGLTSVFLTVFRTKLFLGIAGFVVVTLFVWFNLKFIRNKIDFEDTDLENVLENTWIFKLMSVILGFIAALALTNYWDTVLKFLNSTSFGRVDPIFSNDISFYVFELPFLQFILNFVLVLISLTLISVVLVYGYYYYRKFKSGMELSMIIDEAKAHVLSLLALFFIFLSGRVFIERYSILFSERGVVHGATYVDVNVVLPLFIVVSVVSLIVGFILLLSIKKDTLKLSLAGVILMILVVFAGQGLVFGVQSLYVEPNEFGIERGYIERNINSTLYGYDLHDVDVVDYDVGYNLSMDDIEENQDTIENIRLWDDRALQDTYSQLQLIRTYYDFNDVDVDRYQLGDEYRQVMLSLREMNHDRLPSRTWVNEHLIYTHGYGAVVSPVGEVTEAGLPDYYVKDIPPEVTESSPESAPLELENPAVYYGELTDSYAVTNTDEEEFHYSDGEENVYTTYDGTGGFEIGNLFNRLALAINLGDVRILISSALDSESNIHFRRNIVDRLNEVAPFLEYDEDPYPVINDGQIKWIVDTYTTTDSYPYSEMSADFNYIRNSVKATVDAYDGDLNFYVIEDDDPLVNTYREIFPELFNDFEEMDEGLQEHVRYPETMFSIQRDIYKTYHMQDPRVFYNKEDQWAIPRERYRERRIDMDPYYVTMNLPGMDDLQFLKMSPFTPEDRENMIGWMGAKSDTPNYGDIILYRFPKGRLIYGPSQIESRIDQVDEISERFSLWGQSGSRVLRGNLMVIPIEDSILYVEPVFLMSEDDAIPELRRVIVAYADRIVMDRTLEDALDRVFTEEEPTVDPIEDDIDAPVDDLPVDDDTLQRIREAYESAQDYLRQGDFENYAREIERIGEMLEGV